MVYVVYESYPAILAIANCELTAIISSGKCTPGTQHTTTSLQKQHFLIASYSSLPELMCGGIIFPQQPTKPEHIIHNPHHRFYKKIIVSNKYRIIDQ